MSGAGVIKGDLFAPTATYYHSFECKNFRDSVIMENLLSAKSNNLYSWWTQACREAEHMRKNPAVVFKKDRGQILIAIAEDIPELNCLSIRSDLGDVYIDVNIFLFKDWLASKLPEEIAS